MEFGVLQGQRDLMVDGGWGLQGTERDDGILGGGGCVLQGKERFKEGVEGLLLWQIDKDSIHY